TAPARRRTQAERSGKSDRALISAAVHLIADRGYQRTTLSAIGDAAGYSRGLVTQRFGSKEGLLWAVLDRLLDSWTLRSAGPRVGSRVGVDALQATVEAYLHVVETAPDSVRAYHALLREADGPVPEVRRRIAQVNRDERDGIAGWLRAGQAVGTVRHDVDPAAVAVTFLAVIRGTTTQWLLDPSVDIAGGLRHYAASLDHTLGVQP
ncbi:MAG: TetR/AcrR family transcriptional regulator, partial [Acidimicrobiales bacterium]